MSMKKSPLCHFRAAKSQNSLHRYDRLTGGDGFRGATKGSIDASLTQNFIFMGNFWKKNWYILNIVFTLNIHTPYYLPYIFQ